jgi:hypothetical protein
MWINRRINLMTAVVALLGAAAILIVAALFLP